MPDGGCDAGGRRPAAARVAPSPGRAVAWHAGSPAGCATTSTGSTPTARSYVLRVLDPAVSAAGLGIPPEQEIANTLARGATAGVGAAGVEVLPDVPALVLEFLPGRTLRRRRRARPEIIPTDRGRLPPAARRPAVRQRLRHLRQARRNCSTSARGTTCRCRTATSTDVQRWTRSRRRWPPTRRRPCRATTTCWRRTSSTRPATCASSTTSSPATTTRPSSSATSPPRPTTTRIRSAAARGGVLRHETHAGAARPGAANLIASNVTWTLWFAVHHGLLAERPRCDFDYAAEAADKWGQAVRDLDAPGPRRGCSTPPRAAPATPLCTTSGRCRMATTSPQRVEQPLDDDDQRLAELGYKQELRRKWSGFSNFAISFSIISILAGCFTTFGQAWNNGGPVAISWGWPLISIFILIIGFCMSELVSAYPTAGGIYWWAAKMGKPVHGWFTGWLNLVGLIAVTASVDYGCATFLNLTLSAAVRRLGRHAEPGVPAVRDHPGAARADQHLRPRHHRHAAERLGVVARVRRGRGRADPDLRAGRRTRASSSSSPSGSTTPASVTATTTADVLVLRAAARLPAHPVHDHRVRRVRARVGGDQGRVARGGPRASGSPSSTRRSAAGSCCWRSCSRPPTSTRSTRPAASPARSSRPRSTPASSRPSSSSRRSASSSAA